MDASAILETQNIHSHQGHTIFSSLEFVRNVPCFPRILPRLNVHWTVYIRARRCADQARSVTKPQNCEPRFGREAGHVQRRRPYKEIAVFAAAIAEHVRGFWKALHRYSKSEAHREVQCTLSRALAVSPKHRKSGIRFALAAYCADHRPEAVIRNMSNTCEFRPSQLRG